MSGYTACCLYRALKLHFTTDYDFNKYKGKVKYTPAQFDKNSHKYVYEKLAKKFSDEDLKKFFIANFLQNENVWVQDLLSQEAYENFVRFNTKCQSLSYVFEGELISIFGEENHKLLFKSNSDDLPLLLTKLLRNEVSPETILIMNEFLHFLPKWEENIKDEFVWPKVKLKLFKYRSFLEYDKSKFKKTFIDTVKEFTE
jgi:hypothetical protein